MADFKSSGEQLETLRDELQEKADQLKEVIDADEEKKDAILSELKAVTMKLDEVDRRMAKLNAAKKEYMKTFQEVDFALQKLRDASEEIGERIDIFKQAGAEPGAAVLKEAGLDNMVGDSGAMAQEEQQGNMAQEMNW